MQKYLRDHQLICCFDQFIRLSDQCENLIAHASWIISWFVASTNSNDWSAWKFDCAYTSWIISWFVASTTSCDWSQGTVYVYIYIPYMIGGKKAHKYPAVCTQAHPWLGEIAGEERANEANLLFWKGSSRGGGSIPPRSYNLDTVQCFV
jgi:hypothetical protein